MLAELDLHDARTAKQHAIADHCQPKYCPRCYSIFNTAAERDKHFIALSCEIRDGPAEGLPIGVSEDQEEELSRQSDGKHWAEKFKGRWKRDRLGGKKRKGWKRTTPSEEGRWFRTWDILFPGVPRPDSAYLSAPHEREITALRRFWRKVGPELASSLLEERGLLQWSALQEDASIAAFYASVFIGMVEELGFRIDRT